MFNASFNNISVISWQSVLLVEETGVPGENHWHVASHWQTYHIMLHRVHLAWAGFELTPFVVIATNCIYSYKSNYHMITTTTDPKMTGVIITNECTVGDRLWSYRFTRAGSAYPSGAPAFIPGFLWGSCYIFSFKCMFCRSLFVFLSFFFLPLCCLSFFDLRILITPLLSSNSSYR